MINMLSLYLLVPLAPLAGAIIAGFFGKIIGRAGAHTVTILGVAIALLASLLIFQDVMQGHPFSSTLYTWATSGGIRFELGFLIDKLTVTMMLIVNFVSLMVHIYTIGYMRDDPGYQRFFSYISLFTFSMLMLVMSNNFLQLFFGWEAVGLVSYLLIGFWYTRPSAIYANLKAFLVNRVGDFGFLLGIGLIAAHCGTLNYAEVFAQASTLATKTITLFPSAMVTPWLLISVICICLFIGAMSKSAQFPLHVWLPDSMEGPTPISALIHAATMVTAGIFMVSRLSPLFELSEAAHSFILYIGAITTFFMALIAIVQTDIKRVVAYSTLSQLGYMTIALGASAYSAAIFHLMTHAFFKALLFLGAGSVIIAMHHEQDMTKMGGLRKAMPITYLTVLMGALASAGVPGFSGFFSKDAIIEAVKLSTVPGAGFAYVAAVSTVFVTALYTFRLVFMTFHGKPRMDHHTKEHLHESPKFVTLPLILLAIPSVSAGWLIGPMLFGHYFGDTIYIAPKHPAMTEMAAEFQGVLSMMAHALHTLPFWLSVAGIFTAWFLYIRCPSLPSFIKRKLKPIVFILENKYGLDTFNDWFFACGARYLGHNFWKYGDQAVIDGTLVNGSARLVRKTAFIVRLLQSGHIYQYAFSMIIGLVVLLTVWMST